jgi:hypothetical protein
MNTSGTSGTTTTYPITVMLDQTAVALYDGAGSTVSIDVGTAANVLSVPTSAVHSIGALATVEVYHGGKITLTRVTLGVEGVDRTEIKSGLTAGQQVVLADVSAAIPTATTNGRGFGGAGLGGAGLGGSGLGAGLAGAGAGAGAGVVRAGRGGGG